MVYKTKKYKFAVEVDEYGRKKEALSEFIDVLSEEYPFIKEANRVITKKRVVNAKKGDIIIFGFSKKYDFRVVTDEQWEEFSVSRRTPLVELSEDWEEMMDLLAEYAAANYPNEFEEEDRRYYCCKNEVVIVDDYDFDDVYVIQQQPKKKNKFTTKRKTYKKNNLKLDEVSVHHTHVKVGWDVFDIWLNGDGEEYVKVDGNIYWIDRDSNGKGRLSVQ